MNLRVYLLKKGVRKFEGGGNDWIELTETDLESETHMSCIRKYLSDRFTNEYTPS